MEVKLLSYESVADEDFIDMEVSSFSTFFSCSAASPPRNREFEFQMEREPSTSPADELFYKGKLLPLHLPPRLQMVEKLLQNSTYRKEVDFDEFYSTPLTTTAAPTPFESCNISPSESRQTSRELNREEYMAGYSSFIRENSKKTLTQKLKMIKQSSRAYLKSLFGKSSCSTESCAVSRKPGMRSVSGQIPKEQKNQTDVSKRTEERPGLHRRSFSLAIRRNSVNKVLSSSSSSVSSSFSSSSSSSSTISNSSNGFHGLQFLKRSGSVNPEMENSIQGAIAHCKKSQQLFCSRKTVTEAGFYSLSSSSTVCVDQEMPEICNR